MRCLFALVQYQRVSREMMNDTKMTRDERATVLVGHNAEPSPMGRLEVNVIFTTPQATALALKTAAAFGAELDACIRLRAVIAVSLGLPIDSPQVSIPFMQRTLAQLVTQLDDRLNITIHLYVSRDRIKTLLWALRPNSLVMIGGRMRAWPTEESRTVRHLQAKGHRVVFIPLRGRD
jgi:hypothetical protein